MKMMPCVEKSTWNMVLLDIEIADTSKYIIPWFVEEVNRNDDDILNDVIVSKNLQDSIDKAEYEKAISKNTTIKK